MDRAELGIDGDHAFALYGEDLQAGEAEFEKIKYDDPRGRLVAELTAAKIAFHRLRDRLGRTPENLSYWFGLSHPYGN